MALAVSNPSGNHRITTADDTRRELGNAFTVVDTDSSGFLDKKKLLSLVENLHIPLKDAKMDVDALIDFMDHSHNSKVCQTDFQACFEPFIHSREAKGLELEVEEVMKDALTTVLSEARAQRNYVNAAFLETSQRMEKDHEGFGVNFWGSSWRFRMYDDFYSSARAARGAGAGGAVLPYSQRYGNLKARLAAVAAGADPWIDDTTAADHRIRSELGNPAAVRKFCAGWLAGLDRAERARAAPAEPPKDVAG